MKTVVFGALLALCPLSASAMELYFGADLSYANQIVDCGGIYRDNGKPADVYTIFKDHGANLIRVRIWTAGNKSPYSNLLDVIRTSRAARKKGIQVLLDSISASPLAASTISGRARKEASTSSSCRPPWLETTMAEAP